jgi:hypothetical protein
MASNGEVWRDVPSLPGVLVSSEGRIMHAPHRRPMPHGGLRPYERRRTPAGFPRMRITPANTQYRSQSRPVKMGVLRLAWPTFPRELP